MKRILTMITAASLSLMAWTSHAVVATYEVGDSGESCCDSWSDVTYMVEEVASENLTITITLKKNVTVEEPLYVFVGSVEFDLNGHTLTGDEDHVGDIFVVWPGAQLTIKDSGGTGCVSLSDDYNKHAVSGDSGSTVNIQGGVFDCKVSSYGYSYTIFGGKFSTAKNDENVLEGHLASGLTWPIASEMIDEHDGYYWVVTGSSTLTTVLTAEVSINGGKVETKTWDQAMAKINNLGAGTNATVKLVESGSLTTYFDLPKGSSVTLDLNGKTMTMKSMMNFGDIDYGIDVFGSLTINDTSDAKMGCIVDGGSVNLSDFGTVIVNGGIFDTGIM